MKHIFFLSGLLLSISVSYSQNKNEPTEVTPAIVKKINQEIAKEVTQLKTKLSNSKESDATIEFTTDTFRIEKYQEKYIEYDWTTAGMRIATFELAAKYDSLLNKYYKKLLAVLKQPDKATLINAQKSWIQFRDNEYKLTEVVGKDEYSGGGTIQQLIDADSYLEIIQQRTFQIYQHYIRATQSY